MKILSVYKDVEQIEFSYIPSGIIKWYNYFDHFGKEFGSF